MKLARGDARDIDGVRRLHEASNLDLETLVTRYREMLPGHIGRPMTLKAQLPRSDRALVPVSNRRSDSTANCLPRAPEKSYRADVSFDERLQSYHG